MGKYRQQRVGDAARQEICDILRDVKDPRISSSFITITSVEVTPDFKYAKVYYSTLSDNATPDEKKSWPPDYAVPPDLSAASWPSASICGLRRSFPSFWMIPFGEE